MYLHERLADRYATEVVPGVTSFSAAAAAAGTPLVAPRRRPHGPARARSPPDVLAARLRAGDAAVVIKLGRTFPRRAPTRPSGAGVAERAIYVERASSDDERIAPLADGRRPGALHVAGAGAELRGRARNGRRGRRRASSGSGPAGPDWLTPEAQRRAGGRRRAVGYETYLARVPERRGQRRHATDNRVEAERARARARAGGRRRARRGRLVRRPGDLRHGRRRARGVDGDAALADVEVRDRAGPLGHAGRRGPRRRAARPRLLRRLAVGPAQAVGRRRAAPRRGAARPTSSSRSTTRRRARGASSSTRAVEVLRAPSRRRDAGRRRARGRRADEESVTVTTLGALDARRRRHAHAADRRLVDDAHDRQGEPPRVYTPRRYPA